MKFHPDLQAIIDTATSEHGENVGKSVAFGLALGAATSMMALTMSSDITPKEEEQLGVFMIEHLSYLSRSYDEALGLTEEQSETTVEIVANSVPVVMELLKQGVNEIVLIN